MAFGIKACRRSNMKEHVHDKDGLVEDKMDRGGTCVGRARKREDG
jgi:hypothetical protein